MFRKKIRIVMFMFLLVLTSLANVSLVCAAEGAGSAGSQAGTPGVSGQKPLAYLGTTLDSGGGKVDNATDIPLNPKFKLEFDKNVVNILFWTNNSKCFSMKSSNDENVPLNVTKVDDTVSFDLRQFIFVQPVSPLKPGTSYQLIVSKDLQAKNGVAILGGTTNGQGVSISFKTQGEAVQLAPATPTAPVSQPTTAVVTPPPASTSTPTPTSTPNMANNANEKTTSSNTVTPSSTADPTKPGDSQNPNKESTSITPNNSENAQPKIAEQTSPASGIPSSNEPKKGSGMSGTTWLTIIGVVLVVAWIAVEIIGRRKRK